MKPNKTAIGTRLKHKRTEQNFTQSGLAAATGIAGETISRIECGAHLPSAADLLSLSLVLHCSVDWLLTGDLPGSEAFIHADKEAALLSGFRSLPCLEQDELLEMLQIKLRKIKKINSRKLFPLTLICNNTRYIFLQIPLIHIPVISKSKGSDSCTAGCGY
jgi:transcriptional regulator with XRE-family HTH domain